MTERVTVLREPGPNEFGDPVIRSEIKRASVWFGMAIAVALVVLLIQPLLIIFAGIVFASMLDGGVRLLGRVLPIGRGWRLLIVVVLTIAFVLGVIYMTGVQIADQAEQLRATLMVQAQRVSTWLSQLGLMPGRADINSIVQQALGSMGRLTSFVGTALGALASGFMIAVIGLFIAMEPRLYDRGLQWMVPLRQRDEFAIVVARMAKTLRRLLAGRLLGMVFEGALTWIALLIAGVPMPLILGIITGLLAFIPNVGAFISGVLMVAVGFSAGASTGFAAIFIYFAVQTFDGYVLLPIVARKTVDIPPALTLGSQILASALLGIMGLALADPLTAMIKVAMERGSERAQRGTDRRGTKRLDVGDPDDDPAYEGEAAGPPPPSPTPSP